MRVDMTDAGEVCAREREVGDVQFHVSPHDRLIVVGLRAADHGVREQKPGAAVPTHLVPEPAEDVAEALRRGLAYALRGEVGSKMGDELRPLRPGERAHDDAGDLQDPGSREGVDRLLRPELAKPLDVELVVMVAADDRQGSVLGDLAAPVADGRSFETRGAAFPYVARVRDEVATASADVLRDPVHNPPVLVEASGLVGVAVGYDGDSNHDYLLLPDGRGGVDTASSADQPHLSMRAVMRRRGTPYLSAHSGAQRLSPKASMRLFSRLFLPCSRAVAQRQLVTVTPRARQSSHLPQS